jgi:hypothetical protein
MVMGKFYILQMFSSAKFYLLLVSIFQGIHYPPLWKVCLLKIRKGCFENQERVCSIFLSKELCSDIDKLSRLFFHLSPAAILTMKNMQRGHISINFRRKQNTIASDNLDAFKFIRKRFKILSIIEAEWEFRPRNIPKTLKMFLDKFMPDSKKSKLFVHQGCQMVYFQARNPNLGKFSGVS